nr:LysR substrate-binding domain-containing protein [Oleomonas cavernae]
MARHTLIDTSEDRRYWRLWLEVVGLDTLKGERAQVITILDMALRVAEQGLGVAIGDVPLIADDIALGRLVAPFRSRCRQASTIGWWPGPRPRTGPRSRPCSASWKRRPRRRPG